MIGLVLLLALSRSHQTRRAENPLDAPSLSKDLLTITAELENRTSAKIKPKAKQVETAFVDSRARDLAKRTGKDLPKATRAIIQMMQGGTLADSDLLQMKNGKWVLIGELFDDPENHNLSMPDPIEGIEYGKDKATLKIQPRKSHPTEHRVRQSSYDWIWCLGGLKVGGVSV